MIPPPPPPPPWLLTPLQVYLVDYGLAYRFCPDGRHKEYKEDPRRKHDGTLEFTSIDAHKGVSKWRGAAIVCVHEERLGNIFREP